jgi:BlaI family penicillinase repressor
MPKKDLELYDTEWAILRVVWEQEPCAAPTVQEALAKQRAWTYATVKTLMDRMVKKGLLKVKRMRNLYIYQAGITRARAQESEVRRAVKQAFDGAFSPLMHFVLENEDLTQDDYQKMEQLIRQRKRQ